MVQQRLVERNEDAQDRRQKQVVISAAGLALLEQLVEARLAKIGPITAALPPELRAQLDQLLDQVLEVLRQEPL
jgi:DNA-binding MarR family transcriptional regulator